jgi:guanylate kinase
VECFLCKKVYDLPPDSDLKKDDEFRELLNKGLQNFKPSKEYSILIRDLNGTKLQIENLIDDPSNFIANQFQDIIAKVDLRKEEINKYLRKIIEEIEESKKQIEVKYGINLDENKKYLNNILQDLDNLDTQLGSIFFQEHLSFVEAAQKQLSKINEQCDKFKNGIMLNKGYDFVIKNEKFEDCIGEFRKIVILEKKILFSYFGFFSSNFFRI